ncbi:DUF3857 domain-containing protein [Kiritimatiella glycovorans]|uniref:DUF3857 domain-containing protein n=1 Tax=Kiritimatiella glycovorans TaxID=1307763 RepID=A0A0G3EIC9_9BACT|nr:DUF3857 domain-containing protein [Kiritimatiella glycovorans]AKJ64570.1 putative protein involved in cytokinesis, contains TGc (transglutaminase/protease-like) domain [Kiritimatiella glycovorans]
MRRRTGIMLSFLLVALQGLALEFPSPDKLCASARGVDRDRYPNADAVMLSDMAFARYAASGVYTTRVDMAWKILSEQGKRDHRTQSLGFDRAYSRARFERVEVIRADGRVREVDLEANTREMASPGQMQMNIYNPSLREVRVSIPGLEIGDILRYRARYETFKTRVPGTWSDRFLFEGTDPVLHAVFEIDAPASRPLTNIALKDPVDDTVSHSVVTNGARIRYRWTGRDLPRMFPEPSMPDLSSQVQRVLVSTIPEWEALSRWYWNLSKPHLDKITPEMKRKVAELTSEAGSRDERLRAIFTWVSQNIRYMGITLEKEAPGYEPHDVDLTFERGYGVCRDKAALLVAMLREGGFDAYPVLMMVGAKKDGEVPQPWFNHAVVGVREPGGTFRLMDPTDENTRNLLPRYLCDMSYLAATPEGVPLMTSPVSSAGENLTLIETDGRLDSDGRYRAKTVITFEGINDSAYRGHFARLRPEEREDFFEGRLETLIPGAKLRDLTIEPQPVRDTSRPLKATLAYTATGLFAEQNGKRLFRPPEWGGVLGVARSVLGNLGLEKREYPLRTRFPCGTDESFRIDLARGIAAPDRLPEAGKVDRPFFAWERKWSLNDRVLEGRTRTLVRAIELSPEAYGELKAEVEGIEQAGRQRIVFPLPLEKDPGADVLYLKNSTKCDLEDARNWTETHTVKKKVLTYAGKKEHAELKLHYNPSWEEVELKYARVTSPGGRVHEIRENEINVMDAGWVAGAPRYPAARILVASLPNVVPGSVIEYRVVHRMKDHPFFHLRSYMRGFDPMMNRRVEIAAPKDVVLKIRKGTDEAVVFSEMRNDGRITRSWESRSQRGLKRESDLPPLWEIAPAVFASAGAWEDYAATLRDEFAARASRADRAASMALRLVKGADSPRAKIRAIRDFVARHIRAAGPPFTETPLEALSGADVTLESGYGHAADRAILLYAMLEAAGFAPDWVFASGLPRPDPLAAPMIDYPQRDAFDSPLIRVMLDDGPVYLNDADQYAPPTSTPRRAAPPTTGGWPSSRRTARSGRCGPRIATATAGPWNTGSR